MFDFKKNINVLFSIISLLILVSSMFFIFNKNEKELISKVYDLKEHHSLHVIDSVMNDFEKKEILPNDLNEFFKVQVLFAISHNDKNLKSIYIKRNNHIVYGYDSMPELINFTDKNSLPISEISSVVEKKNFVILTTKKNFSFHNGALLNDETFVIELSFFINDELSEVKKDLFVINLTIFTVFLIIFLLLNYFIYFYKSIMLKKENEINERFIEVNNLNIGLDDIVKSKTNEMIKLKERFEYFAYHDPLTDMYNRFFFMDFLAKKELEYINEVAILMVDLNNFKYINETLGHNISDIVLKEAAQRIITVLPEQCVCSRFGGEEFVIYFEKYNIKNNLEIIASAIISAFKVPFNVLEISVSIIPNIGIGIRDSYEEELSNVVTKSGLALLESQQKGKGFFEFFEKRMEEKQSEKFALEKKIKNALTNSEFEIYYQPLMNNKGDLLGAEALCRWFDKEEGKNIPPIKFIPIAEEMGLIIPLGYYIINKICHQKMLWNEKGLKVKNISFNVSIKQLFNSDFVNILRDTVRLYDLNPEEFTIELTESCFADKELTKIINEIFKLGFAVAIDDFGTGYSSLSYLKRLPITKLKIDKSFVDDCENNNDDKIVIETIIKLAKQFNLKINAEGVETETQSKILIDLGVDELQGYLYEKPLSVSDFEKKFFVKE